MDIRIPRLGEGADTGSVVSILVKEGDPVKKDQTILELENEKAVAAIPSTHDGVISKIHVKVGDEVTVGQVIVSLSDQRREERQPEAGSRKQEDKETEKNINQNQSLPASGFQLPTSIEPPAAPSIRSSSPP